MSNPKLPVWATVRQAYAAVREQSHVLAKIAQRWGIAAAAGLALGVWLVGALPPDQFPTKERVAMMTSLPVLILGLGAYVIIVRWHRLVVQSLTAEQTRPGAVGSGVLYFARAMFLIAVGVCVALVGSLLPITLTRKLLEGDAQWIFAAVVTAMAITAALALLARLCLILPAGAVQDYSVTLRRSWSLTNGNTMRMLAGSALASGPAVVMNFVINAAARASETTARDATAIGLVTVFSLVLAIIAGVIQAGFLSYAYMFFTGRGGIVSQPPSVPEGH